MTDTAAPDSSADDVPATPTNLKPVIDVIPASCYDNPTSRGLAYFARDLVVYGLVLVGLFSTDKLYFLIPLWILAGLVVSALFVVGHDAAHQALFKSKRMNGVVGRLAMLPSLHVFEAWVLGHNRVHHGHTVKVGFDFVWHPVSPEEYAALSKWQRLLHRIEWSSVGYGLYYGRRVWWQKMMSFDPPKRWASAIRRDTWFMKGVAGAIGIGFIALGWWHYGSALGGVWMLVKLGVIPFVLFCFSIGLVVHIHHIDRNITVVEPARVEQVPRSGRRHHDHPCAPLARLLPALDPRALAPPRGHAHPDVPPERGGPVHRRALPGPRAQASPARHPGQHPGLQALRLRPARMADLPPGRRRTSLPD